MNVRLSILLVLVLLVFGGTFLAIKLTGSDEPRETDPWLYSIDSGNITRVSVTYQDDTFTYQQTPGSPDWIILGEPEIPVFPDKWAGITLLLSGPSVPLEDETIRDPEQYGLEPPVTEVTVSDRSGNVVEFHLGNATPDALRHYARLVGNPELFTVPDSMATVVNGLVTNPPYLQLFQVNVDNLELMEVTSGGESSGYFRDRDTSQWFIRAEPIGASPQVFPEAWADTPEFISGPRADRVEANSFDDPSMYGLDPPHTSVRLLVRDAGVTEFHLGNPTDDGRYRYARVLDEAKLYAVPEPVAQRISALATDPPYIPETTGDPEG